MIELLYIQDIAGLSPFLARKALREPSVERAAADILASVEREGDAALFRLTRELDRAELDTLEVSRQEIQEAYDGADPEFLRVLELAGQNISEFHHLQKRAGFVLDTRPGVLMGQRVIPLDRVGLYVPGGTASYPSTVLMNAIPAKIAGVPELIMATPPRPDGKIAPAILAAARTAGVDRVFKLGGAQAVGAMAYGTQSVPRVDKIVGPGNIYVATAKRMVFGLVDIEMIAGPSEILVLADQTADPASVAADMLSQAEHDRLARAILVTDSEELAQKTIAELERQLQTLPRRDIAAAALRDNSAAILVPDLGLGIEVSNQIAPEHLEIRTRDPFALLPLARHAGSVFLGHYVPEALGDYLAGPNHTLPTAGAARFSSPLSVDDFVKRSSFVYYDREAFARVAPAVAAFARIEGLEAHARSVEVRQG